MKKIKEMFQSPQSRYGTYSMVITAVVIAIVIVINMIAGQLPDSMKSVDLSGNSLYEITKTSKKLLKNLDKEVQIHVLAEKSSTDERTPLLRTARIRFHPEYNNQHIHRSRSDTG